MEGMRRGESISDLLMTNVFVDKECRRRSEKDECWLSDLVILKGVY